MTNRIILCTFWEKSGRLSEANAYYLKALLPLAQRILLVVNGEINNSSVDCLEQLGIQYIKRENVGLDFGAWREAILHLGWSEISKYDELVITNLTAYGPVYPLEEMFSCMSKRICDFWGINKHPENLSIRLVPSDPQSTLFEHIQSNFVVFRKKVILSDGFRKFWKHLQLAKSYAEEVAYHECRLTLYLERLGFKSDTYMPFQKYSRSKGNPSLLEGYNQLVEDRNPFIKKKIFSLPLSYWVGTGNWGQCAKILSFLKEKTSYPEELIIKELLATVPMSTIQTNLHLVYPLDKSSNQNSLQDDDVAVVFFAYYEDQVSYNLSYLINFPKMTVFYLLSSREILLNIYEESLRKEGFVHIQKRLLPPRGRDVAAYLIGAADVYKKHKYICCLHDKKTAQAGYLVGTAFRDHNMQALVSSRQSVLGAISAFMQNEYLGMLIPPTFPLAVGNEMSSPNNRRLLLRLFKDYAVDVPFDETPLAPFGSMFWLRGKAFDILNRKIIKFDDFPKEPMPNDGTISHAYERFYPILVQESGFYTAWCGSSDYLKQYFALVFYAFREYQNRLYKINGFLSFSDMLSHMDTVSINAPLGVRKSFYNLLRSIKWRYFPKKNFSPIGTMIKRLLKLR